MKRAHWLLGKKRLWVVYCCECGGTGGGCRHYWEPFEITARPMVRYGDLFTRRFNVLDRAQDRVRQEIQAQEDAMIFRSLDFANRIDNEEN